MTVRFVSSSNRLVPNIGMAGDNTRPTSMTYPVRINRDARSTACGVMWFIAPRLSAGPHFEGQRAESAGGCQLWARADTGSTVPTIRVPRSRTVFADASADVVVIAGG